MSRNIADSVVVITGASSGIGRAAAYRFAEEGATLVLAARREDALNDVVRECERRGARAIACPVDMSDESAVLEMARRTIENFGRIDVWVNNAAVSLFARFEEAPTEAVRRVIDTNLFGYIHGARACLPYFREQGSGTLINVSSVVAEAMQPYTSAYVMTKAAIRALSDCLRMELNLDNAPEIHVCTVLPASIDTPLFQQAANYTGHQVKPLEPVYSADDVARAIVNVARHPQREVVVGAAGRIGILFHRNLPGLYECVGARHIDRNHLQDQAAPFSAGNLYEPMPEYARVSGGWKPNGQSPLMRWALVGLAVAAPLGLYWARRQRLLPRLV